MECSKAFLCQSTPIPIPLPPKKILLRFTLISRMVLGVGKKSEIRLKSEDSVPAIARFSQTKVIFLLFTLEPHGD